MQAHYNGLNYGYQREVVLLRESDVNGGIIDISNYDTVTVTNWSEREDIPSPDNTTKDLYIIVCEDQGSPGTVQEQISLPISFNNITTVNIINGWFCPFKICGDIEFNNCSNITFTSVGIHNGVIHNASTVTIKCSRIRHGFKISTNKLIVDGCGMNAQNMSELKCKSLEIKNCTLDEKTISEIHQLELEEFYYAPI